MPDLFVADQAEARRGGGFRWFFSTCLAATVGAVAIGAVIFGSMDLSGGPGRVATTFRQISAFPKRVLKRPAGDAGGLAWSIPKSDLMQTTMDAISARYTVHDAIKEFRANREYLMHKPFARVVIRLAAVEQGPATAIPPFNPLKLYSNPAADAAADKSGGGQAQPEGGEVTLRVVELLGSILPAEDGQEIDDREAADLVVRSLLSESDAVPIRTSFAPEGLELKPGGVTDALEPNTTILAKSGGDAEEIDDAVQGERVRVSLRRGESLVQLLGRMGAESWQAKEMVESARRLLPEAAIATGASVEVVLVPSLSREGKTEPARFSVFGSGGEHMVTVERNDAGEFVASATRKEEGGGQAARAASVYASIYHGALAQDIPPETIETILKVHAYEADFRRRARGSDQLELFFDLKEQERGSDGALGELLVTSLTVGGSTHRLYRFKGPDGVVDYYDENGNNSRRFLLRKPVRSEDVRLTSGYGVRFHPLLNTRKLHSGIDWAARSGTPIIAAGNGTIEEARYKGQYGNYVRLRHANGYQTAYAHMRGFASGIKAGGRVRQGQVIGYLGSTGLSSGPHLHFEVLVNSRFVDPLSIAVPREKRLTGRQLAAFQRERVRIDELMRRPPVRVRTVEAKTR